MDDRERAERLKALSEKIDAAKGVETPTPKTDEHYSMAQHAWRMVIELVAGLVIGFGIGYGVDAVFGTRPIFLVVFILLGFAAGIRTMMRTARELQDDQQAFEAGKDKRD
ncbi:MAG: AtpZ/AtpI family protein [Alphaproteobacteria bacterium]|nr:AtpZ/AtpI family protein [Alphaproteobacteria bacterium]NNF25510.1 AtpZ/AtpI family protein [Paracoccaceae bacterium]